MTRRWREQGTEIGVDEGFGGEADHNAGELSVGFGTQPLLQLTPVDPFGDYHHVRHPGFDDGQELGLGGLIDHFMHEVVYQYFEVELLKVVKTRMPDVVVNT
jgi:hypothetical protein